MQTLCTYFFIAKYCSVTEVADSYIKLSTGVLQLANLDPGPLDKFLAKVSDYLERARVRL